MSRNKIGWFTAAAIMVKAATSSVSFAQPVVLDPAEKFDKPLIATDGCRFEQTNSKAWVDVAIVFTKPFSSPAGTAPSKTVVFLGQNPAKRVVVSPDGQIMNFIHHDETQIKDREAAPLRAGIKAPELRALCPGAGK